MPYKRGAPPGNTNRLKHGRFTGISIAQRKLVRQTIRAARLAMLQAFFEISAKDITGCPRVDKST